MKQRTLSRAVTIKGNSLHTGDAVTLTIKPAAVDHGVVFSRIDLTGSPQIQPRVDHVTDLRIEPRELADRGVRFIKVPAALLLDQRQASTADIHASDLSDLLGRFGIDLIAERIEGERAVVDLLDYDVRFGQGFLFAPPRPLRPEGASATGGSSNKVQESNGFGKTPPVDLPTIDPPRATGMAALARRVAGPG